MRAVHVDVGLEPTTKKAGISPPAPCVFISCGVVTSIQRIAAHCDREKLAAFFLSRGSSPLSRRPEINQPFQEPVACSFRAFCVWLFRFRTQIPLALGRFKTRRLIRLPTTGIGMIFVTGVLWSVHPHQKRMNSSSAHDLTVSWLPRGDVAARPRSDETLLKSEWLRADWFRWRCSHRPLTQRTLGDRLDPDPTCGESANPASLLH